MCSVQGVSQQTAVVSPHSVDRLVFVMATRVPSEVRTRFVYFSCTNLWFRGLISWFANFVRCSGSTLRKERGTIEKTALDWNPQGYRRRGRPKRTWRRTIEDEIRSTRRLWNEVKGIAGDRNAWKLFMDSLWSTRSKRVWWWCSGSSKSLNNSANIQFRLSFCPPVDHLLISPCLRTFGLDLLFRLQIAEAQKSSVQVEVAFPIPYRITETYLNCHVSRILEIINYGTRGSRNLSIQLPSQRSSYGRRTFRCLKEIIARMATSLPSFTSFKVTREERIPTRCNNIDDLLSIVDVDYWQQSRHVSGIFMPIVRRKDHMLLHMECICW